jgi:hypothetical protein
MRGRRKEVGQTSIGTRAPTSLAPYCVTRAPARLVSFLSMWCDPRVELDPKGSTILGALLYTKGVRMADALYFGPDMKIVSPNIYL